MARPLCPPSESCPLGGCRKAPPKRGPLPRAYSPSWLGGAASAAAAAASALFLGTRSESQPQQRVQSEPQQPQQQTPAKTLLTKNRCRFTRHMHQQHETQLAQQTRYLQHPPPRSTSAFTDSTNLHHKLSLSPPTSTSFQPATLRHRQKCSLGVRHCKCQPASHTTTGITPVPLHQNERKKEVQNPCLKIDGNCFDKALPA